MKSIANQYRDLKEGKMTQANFMRNLRMSMPQFVTNTTSFKDAVRILKNKSILTEVTEAIRFQSPGGVDYPGREKQSNYNTDSFDRELDRELEYYEDEYPGLVDFVNKLGNNDETNPKYLDIIDKYFDDPAGAADEFITLFKKQTTDDSELDDMIDRIGGDIEAEKAIQRGFDIHEGKKKKKAKKEEKPYNPNAIHPSELRMGLRVEMEHTDDPKKAEKIALDHLAENPFYYTALKLSGIESPSAPKAKAVVSKKVKKKDATEMVDQANQMQKVKLMKEALEKLIRAELRKH